MLLSLAPLSQSYDFFIAIFCCFFLAFVWLYYAFKASKSGSVEKKNTALPCRDDLLMGDDGGVQFWQQYQQWEEEENERLS